MALEIEEAQALLASQVEQITDTEEVPFMEAIGRVLAEDLTALRDHPPFPRSPLDGYAFCGADSAGASKEQPVRLQVLGKIYAGGVFNGTVRPRQAVKLMTGAPIPEGADAVIRQEDTDEREDIVTLYREVKPYQNYCFQGEDYKAGEVLLPAGTVINAGAIAVISSLGLDKVRVIRKPRVAVITSGDEVLPPGTAWQPGKIYDSNRAYISARLTEEGNPPAFSVHAEDKAESVAEQIRKAVENGCDLVITTGGVSVGEKDIMHDLGPALGAELLFWRIRIKPGSPVMAYRYQGVPIVCLSGNPFGAIANYEIVVRAVLHKLTGLEQWAPKKDTAIMQEDFPKNGGRRFVRGQEKDGKVSLCGAEKSVGVLHALAECNCLVEVTKNEKGVKAGDEVTIYRI